ncbi:MAG: glycerol-3-phosphate 1-O-acyltransferase [Proteobacteria bacterium]|nr:MAG: glycerol-3-phosphate 1-O-acyltransferase [Pseudomonadota bacterium]
MNLRKSIDTLARKTLYLWIKTSVAPANPEALGIKPDQPVIYVLEGRGWSSLLVLEAECENLGLPSPTDQISSKALSEYHSVYTILPREPFKAWAKKVPKRSRMLRCIVESMRDDPTLEVQFVPVSVFWGRPVSSQERWLPVLFADTWRVVGRIRKLFTILVHGRDTFVKYSNVINFHLPAATTETVDQSIDRLQAVLSKRLTDERIATLGPDVSHRHMLVRDLILKPDVQEAIKARSLEENISEYNATLQARRYVHEIVANCTQITVQLMNRALSYFWNKFYSGIDVTNNGDLKELARTHELVYVPCHRSHIDYLLLSYVIYYEGLAVPYIASGRNLDMPVIGSILRGGGAFFIRRSFKGNQLYSAVMFEYVAELVSKGVAIEYFVEGGRSRTGRLLKPRPGMVSMTIRGFLKYRKKPVAFIPVYIGYEKLMEAKAYQAELSGKGKKSETFLNSIRTILRIRGNFGRVSANFGQPIFLNRVLDQEYEHWQRDTYEDTHRPDWVRSSVESVMNKIATRINNAATVNAVNLVATVLLATSRQNMDEAELMKMLAMYQQILHQQPYSSRLVITQETAAEQIARVEALDMLQRRKHELGDILYLDDKHSIAMTYYRNNILHLMALPSVIACCFINIRRRSETEIIKLITLIYPFLQSELFLSWKKRDLSGAIKSMLNTLCEQGLLKKVGYNEYARGDFGSIDFSRLNLLARVISPTLEVYYLTLALLARNGDQAIPKAELEKQCQLMAQRVAIMHDLNSPDYSDKNLIANFIDTLIHIDYVKVCGTEELALSEVFRRADQRVRLLLSKTTRANILQMLEQSKQTEQVNHAEK